MPLTRSPAEISTINSLQTLPSLLLHSHAATSSVTALRSICASQARRQSVTEAKQNAELGTLERWLALAELSAKLEGDAKNLGKEVQAHERKRHALTVDGTKLPPAEACELGPKLQCLEEVLGSTRFRAYCSDLSAQVAKLRQRLGLYDICMRDFERQVGRARFMSKENLQLLFDGRAQMRIEIDGETVEPPQGEAPTVDLTEYNLLLQHCSDLHDGVAVIKVEDLVALLRSLPLERVTMVRHVFEQLADSRKGEGYRPPPDHTKLHRVHAAIKLQRSHCSAEEMQAAEAWLQTLNADDVFLDDFVQFHLAVSDANVNEDADFVRFVQRMWGFSPQLLRDDERRDAIVQLLESYVARCNLAALIARKRELLAKIPGAQSRIQSSTVQLENELQQLRELQAPAGFTRWLQCNDRISTRLGGTFALLSELSLTGQALTAIPDFVLSLSELQTLDVRDNRISTLSPAFGALRNLRHLDVSDNLLRDASFAQLDDMFIKLEALLELRISGNELTTLPASLVAIPNLTALDVSRNALRSIKGSVLRRWEGRCQLKVLDLHVNSLTTLPEEIRVLSESLRRLLLHQNQLTSLPSAAFTDMRRLQELSLYQNQLAGDSLVFFPLASGQEAISLAHNQLKIPPRIILLQEEEQLTPRNLNASVVCVDVRHNRLRSLVDWSPLVLAKCQSLHLQHNALRELPDSFFTCFPALRVCELQSNKLQALPTSVVGCTQLQVLDVHSNRLRELPTELVQLPHLAVLNAAENAIASIPIDWHSFETQHDGARVLQSLSLRRNPLRNKILKEIVDGSADGLATSQSATAGDLMCEGVIKRLLDGLRDASVVLREASRERPTARDAWVDSDDDEPESRNKWRGVARDVNRYLEQRLHAMERPHASGGALMVDVKSFERLIRTLPFTCSKREMAHLVKRFSARDEDDGTSKRQIDGLAFLQAIESFGRWRSMATPSRKPTTSASRPVIDSAGPIIQYLAVLHRRLLQERGDDNQRDSVEQPPKQHYAERGLKVKLRKKQLESKKPKGSNKGKAKPATIPVSTPAPPSKSKSRTDVIVDRQRQRIQVLEQQLLDQKLLLLAQQKPVVTNDDNIAAIAPADLSVMRDDDQGLDERACEDVDSTDQTVIVSVKCLQMHETAGAADHQAEAWRIPRAPARLDVRVLPDDTVLRLKRKLQARTGVPVDHQILVANCVGRSTPAIRLRNDAVVREYADSGGGGNRWNMTLLVGQSLPLFSETLPLEAR